MFKDYLANLRRIGRDARLMIATQAIMGFGYVGLYAVLFNLYLLRLDYNPAYIGQVNAIGRLGFALVGVPAGLLGVRFGPRPLLIAGEWIIVIGLVGAPLGEFLPHAIQGPWISLFYFLGFAGASLFFVNATPFLMAVSGKQERSHVFAVLATVMPLAAFAGSLCGGLLPGLTGYLLGVTDADPAAYRYPLMFAGTLFLLTVPLVLATHHGTTHKQDGEDTVNPLQGMRDAPLGTITSVAAVMFLASIGMGITMSFFNVYLDDGLDVATALIGTVTATTQLVSAFAAVLMPVVIARFGHVGGFQLGRLVMAAGMVPMALVPSLHVAALAMLLITAASSISQQIFTIYSQSAISTRWRTLMSGVVNTTMGCGWAITAWGGGLIIEHFGYNKVFLTGAATTVISVAVFALVARRAPEPTR